MTTNKQHGGYHHGYCQKCGYKRSIKDGHCDACRPDPQPTNAELRAKVELLREQVDRTTAQRDRYKKQARDYERINSENVAQADHYRAALQNIVDHHRHGMETETGLASIAQRALEASHLPASEGIIADWMVDSSLATRTDEE